MSTLIPDGELQGLAWHYGDPLAEQRQLARGIGLVDWSAREVVVLSGIDRLVLLDLLSTARLTELAVASRGGHGIGITAGPELAQPVAELASGVWGYFLDPQGHISFDAHLVDDGDTTWLWTAPGQGEALAQYLSSRRFRLRAEIDYRPDLAIVWAPDPLTPSGFQDDSPGAGGGPDLRPGTPTMAHYQGTDSPASPSPAAEPGRPPTLAHYQGADSPASPPTLARYQGVDSLGGSDYFVPRAAVAQLLEEYPPAGLWAYQARRIAAGIPATGRDTDSRTIPNELGLPSPAVALDKGCYPGQEVVARVHNLGRPPRRLVRLHLDGSAEFFPASGQPLIAPPGSPLAITLPGALDDQPVGYLTSWAYHYELGPIGLGLVERGLPPGRPLEVAGVAATPEIITDPDQGHHFRPEAPGKSRAGSSLRLTTR